MALLQEEAESSRRCDPVRGEGSSNSPLLKHSSAIPSRWDRTSDGGVDPVMPTFTPTTSSVDSKVASLCAYRRAPGLCQSVSFVQTNGSNVTNVLLLFGSISEKEI